MSTTPLTRSVFLWIIHLNKGPFSDRGDGSFLVTIHPLTMPLFTLLCIDDDTLIRDFLIGQLREITPADTVIFSAGDGATGLNLAREHRPDLIILDLGLPDISGFQVIEGLIDLQARTRILVLTASAPDQVLALVQRSKVSGLLLKTDTSTTELSLAIEAIQSGRKYFSQTVRLAMAAARAEPNHFTKILSPRELELMPLFGYGWANDKIARRAGISPATIRTHRQNILSKLNIHSTEKLIHWAILKGFSDYRYEPQEPATAIR